jgi:hypothetical protein
VRERDFLSFDRGALPTAKLLDAISEFRETGNQLLGCQ